MEVFYIYWKHLTDDAKKRFLDYYEMDSSDINNPPNFIDKLPIAESYRFDDLDDEGMTEDQQMFLTGRK